MERNNSLVYICTAGAALLALAWFVAFQTQWIHLDFGDLDNTNIAERLFGFFVIALAVERVTEVIILARFGKEKTDIARRKNIYATQIKAKREALTSASLVGTVDDAAVRQVASDVDDIMMSSGLASLRDENAELKRRIERAALLTGFILGSVLSLSGLRFIESLIQGGFPAPELIGSKTTPAATSNQFRWFALFDAFFSAVILAGGADGIHKIISRAAKLGGDDDTLQL